ncbi:unnamed protein product [Choristocarpus tenellus]
MACQTSSAVRYSSESMTMVFGGFKRGNIKSGVPSKISNLFNKGSRSKGKSNDGKSGNDDGGSKLPPAGPLGSSASADDSGDKQSSNPLIIFWAAYLGLLETQPIITKSLTSMIGFSLGDLLAQKGLEKKEEIDLTRLLRLASFGALIHGSTGHFFYNFLDSKIPGTAALTVAKKVFIDQVIWNPIFGCLFFGYMGAVDGAGPAAIGSKIKNNLWTSVRGSWTVWPVAHAINFRFIPTSQRLLYINTIQIFYNCFLSIIAQRE